jgi:hypothetical protein
MSHRSIPLASAPLNGDDRIVIEAVTPVEDQEESP